VGGPFVPTRSHHVDLTTMEWSVVCMAVQAWVDARREAGSSNPIVEALYRKVCDFNTK
jgi:hypothetical protein